MQNPSAIIDGYVAKMREMPVLVALCGASAANIFGVHERFNNSADIQQVINGLKQGNAMLFFDGSAPARSSGNRDLLTHNFRIAVRLVNQSDYTDFWASFINDAPTSTPNVKLREYRVVGCTYSMSNYQISRAGFQATNGTTIEFFLIGFSVAEAGS